jgi:hypothetical protein
MSRKTSMGSSKKGGSAPQNTNTGSGSRPGGGKFPIGSTKPANPKRIRG